MSRTLITVSIVLAVLLAPFALFAISENYNYCAANQGQYAEPQKDDGNPPFIHGPISNPTFGRLLIHCADVYTSQNADAITAIATVAATLIAVFLFWLSLDQGQTTRAQLRGYVFAKPGPSIVEVGKKPSMEIRLQNYGATPVNKLCTVSDIIVLDLPMKDVVIDAPPGERPPETSLAPNEFHMASLCGTNEITASDLKAIKDKKKGLFFAGTISYRDAFGRKRNTRFNWVWLGEVDAEGKRKITHCDFGNKWA